MDQPCPLCGYDAPTLPCPHCGQAPAEASLARSAPGPIGGALAGLWAVPRGLEALAFTPRVKRLLVPPLLLTLLAFGVAFAWAWRTLDGLLEAARRQDAAALGLDEGWLRSTVEWLIERSIVIWAAQAAGWLVLLFLSSLVAMWTFSIVYEALAGPFLDELHGRLEERWLGCNPRDELERPTDLAASRCALWTALCAAAGLPGLVLWWRLSGTAAWLALAGAAAPLAALSLAWPAYGRWLRWVAAVEGRTLWTSIKASLLAAALLILLFPLRFLPFGIGYLAFGVVTGFTTAITLLDIPFSRRMWSLDLRLRFLRRHLAAMVAFGAVASLLFVIPVLGPVLMVPAASIGGLWLLCRLDKGPLRTAPTPAAREASPPGG